MLISWPLISDVLSLCPWSSSLRCDLVVVAMISGDDGAPPCFRRQRHSGEALVSFLYFVWDLGIKQWPTVLCPSHRANDLVHVVCAGGLAYGAGLWSLVFLGLVVDEMLGFRLPVVHQYMVILVHLMDASS
jgi:hypothetical protein